MKYETMCERILEPVAGKKKADAGVNTGKMRLKKDSTHTITLSEDAYQLLLNKTESTGKSISEIISTLIEEVEKAGEDACEDTGEDAYLLREVERALTHDKKYRTVKKRRDALQRKVQILKAALKLFAKNGYHAVTVNDIIKEVNITRPTFYQHFKNKENIVQLLMDTHKMIMINVFFGTIKSAQEKPVSEWKKIIFKKLEQDLKIYPLYDFIKVIFLELNSVQASFSEDIIALETDMTTLLANALEYGQKYQNFSKLYDPLVAARCIFGGIKKVIADFQSDEEKGDLVKDLSFAYDFYTISLLGGDVEH